LSPAARKPRAPDPGTVCRELCELAGSGRLPRFLVLKSPPRGESEPWFAEQVLEAARAFGRTQPGLDVLEVDGGSPDFEPGHLDGFLGAASLFGNGRALVFGRAAKPLQRWPRLAQSLVAAAADPAGPAWLIVQAEGLAKTAKAALDKALKSLAGGARSESFRRLYADPPPWKPDPDQSEAALFVAAEGRVRGLRMERGAAGLLVSLTGGRPSELVQALEHFALLGKPHVDEDDVRATVAHGAEGNAFEFAEAVLVGDAATALRVLGRLRARGLHSWDGRRIAARDAYSLIVSVLAGERRKTAVVHAALARGAELAAGLREAGVAAGGPPARRMEERLRVCGTEQLDRVRAGLRQVEREVKSGRWPGTLGALEWLALHAHRSRRRAASSRA